MFSKTGIDPDDAGFVNLCFVFTDTRPDRCLLILPDDTSSQECVGLYILYFIDSLTLLLVLLHLLGWDKIHLSHSY